LQAGRVLGGYEVERHTRNFFILSDRLGYLPAIHLRHHDIEQHQIVPVLSQCLQRFPAAGGCCYFYHTVADMEQTNKDVERVRVIIHYQDSLYTPPDGCKGLLQIGDRNRLDQIAQCAEIVETLNLEGN
jgi:hypothetical protein